MVRWTISRGLTSLTLKELYDLMATHKASIAERAEGQWEKLIIISLSFLFLLSVFFSFYEERVIDVVKDIARKFPYRVAKRLAPAKCWNASFFLRICNTTLWRS